MPANRWVKKTRNWTKTRHFNVKVTIMSKVLVFRGDATAKFKMSAKGAKPAGRTKLMRNPKYPAPKTTRGYNPVKTAGKALKRGR